MRAPPLAVRDLQVAASDGRLLLSVVRLDLAPGAALGLRGPSGAGKSTLLHALSGLAAVRRGSVRWGDVDLARLPEARRDRFRGATIGLLFQDFLLLEELSALDNAAIAASWAPRAARGAIRARAAALLERLGVPAGTRRVETLSGGERQRVAAARALATDPAVVIADEPTASLDRATADRLVGDLAALAREGGRTLVVASHDPVVLAAMDRVATVADGALTDDGAAASFARAAEDRIGRVGRG